MPRKKKIDLDANEEGWSAKDQGEQSQTGEASCATCIAWAPRGNSTFGQCTVDLPPFLMRSINKSHHLVNQNYLCVLHRMKG